MTDTASATTHDYEPRMHRGCYGRMAKKPWSIYEIGAILGGFVVFWPVGLLAMFLKMKKGELWKGSSEMQTPWTNWKSHADNFSGYAGKWQRREGFTGNQAFDEYRKTKIEELEALRRKLDEERAAFDDFLGKLRKAKDREDFERFMTERTAPTSQS